MCPAIRSLHVPPKKLIDRTLPCRALFGGQNCPKFVITAKITPKNMERCPPIKSHGSDHLLPGGARRLFPLPIIVHLQGTIHIWLPLLGGPFWLFDVFCGGTTYQLFGLHQTGGGVESAERVWHPSKVTETPCAVAKLSQTCNCHNAYIKPVKVVWSQRGLSTSILAASPILMLTALVCRYVDLEGKEGHRDLAQVTALASALSALLCLTTGAGVWQPVLLHSPPVSNSQLLRLLIYNPLSLLLLSSSFSLWKIVRFCPENAVCKRILNCQIVGSKIKNTKFFWLMICSKNKSDMASRQVGEQAAAGRKSQAECARMTSSIAWQLIPNVNASSLALTKHFHFDKFTEVTTFKI